MKPNKKKPPEIRGFLLGKLHTDIRDKFAFKRNVGQEFTFKINCHKTTSTKIVKMFLREAIKKIKLFLIDHSFFYRYPLVSGFKVKTVRTRAVREPEQLL